VQFRSTPIMVTVCLLCLLAMPAWTKPNSSASIPNAALIQPEELAAVLKNVTAPKPLILQVGFRILYAQAHIPGSEYAGPANEAAGLRSLTQRVAALNRDTAIVIYCGCCPWSHCPNVAAAYGALHALGFDRVKVLHIADSFGENWVNRGYPVVRGG